MANPIPNLQKDGKPYYTSAGMARPAEGRGALGPRAAGIQDQDGEGGGVTREVPEQASQFHRPIVGGDDQREALGETHGRSFTSRPGLTLTGAGRGNAPPSLRRLGMVASQRNVPRTGSGKWGFSTDHRPRNNRRAASRGVR